MSNTGRVFERFTDRARRAVVLAQEEARRLDHDYIGTEHLLLGLVGERDGIAAKALGTFEISLDSARARVATLVGRGVAGPVGHIPFRPHAKKALELSLREALSLGHDYIGTEHLLLGLLRDGEGTGVEVLRSMGADPEQVRVRVLQLVTELGAGAEPGSSATVPGLSSRELTLSALEALIAFWEGDLDRVEQRLGRAVQVATQFGDGETLAALARIVEIDDGTNGQVRLRPRPTRDT